MMHISLLLTFTLESPVSLPPQLGRAVTSEVRCYIVRQIKIRRGSALRLPWATARDRPYLETLSERL